MQFLFIEKSKKYSCLSAYLSVCTVCTDRHTVQTVCNTGYEQGRIYFVVTCPNISTCVQSTRGSSIPFLNFQILGDGQPDRLDLPLSYHFFVWIKAKAVLKMCIAMYIYKQYSCKMEKKQIKTQKRTRTNDWDCLILRWPILQKIGEVYIRDVHGKGIPNETCNPMGIPWE